MSVDILFTIIVLVMSVVVHEVSHGYAARALGDHTAEFAGRLTLNPVKHLDMMGSIIVPGLLVLSQAGFIFGWAKPVPFNPFNLRNQRWGPAIVAAAGPLSNITIALIFGLALRFSLIPESVLPIAVIIVLINIVLAVFNLVPIPPLDGSKILFAILPFGFQGLRLWLERYALFVLLFFIFFLWKFVSPVIVYLFSLLTGFAV